MKLRAVLAVAIAVLGPSSIATADPGFDLNETSYIVVASAKEAVHYKDAPSFHQLKNLINAALSGPAASGEAKASPALYEVHLLSQGQERAYALGQGWLASGNNRYAVKPADFQKMMHIIESRAGQGTDPSLLTKQIALVLEGQRGK